MSTTLYSAEPLSLFLWPVLISAGLVIGAIVLFPFLFPRTSGRFDRAVVILALGILMLLGIARLAVLGIAWFGGVHTITSALDFNTQVNETGRNGQQTPHFVLFLFDKTQGTRDQLNTLPPDDRLSLYARLEVPQYVFNETEQGVCYTAKYYALPRYAGLLLFFHTLDSNPFVTSLATAEPGACSG